MFLPFLLSLLLSTAHAAKSEPSSEKLPPCYSSKEFITALEFLRSQKQFDLSEEQSRKTAESVAQSCLQKGADREGTAKRFIRITELLVKAGLTSKNAIETALEFSARTDAETEAFITIFRYAFLKDYLDLDMFASMNMAKRLSMDFKGNTKTAVSDFEKIVKFCASEKYLDLPRPQCGETAARLAKLGENEPRGVAEAWISSYEFLRSQKKGPGLATVNALELSEELLNKYGTVGLDNFSHAFRYAINKKGLDMSNDEALKFARKMAELTQTQ